MAKKTAKTGRTLERQVADAYRAIGARVVEHDVELAGHQIDVYVEMEAADRSLHRIAVEAKDHKDPVGIGIVSDFADLVDRLRRRGLVDEGIIVSANGFTRPGRNSAKEHGLRLLEPADLEAMVGRPDPTQMRADYLASLRQRFEYLDLGGIAPRVQNRTVKLRMEDVFVPLQARPELELRDEWPGWVTEMAAGEEGAEMAWRMLARDERATETGSLEIPDLLSHPRAVVLGDPGCGKSTLLRHIAYSVACGNTGAVGEATLGRLPIFVRIVQFSQAQAADPSLTLGTYVCEVCEPRWAILFQRALDAGQALLLLDGLDEVIDAHRRKRIAEAIQRLAADYPGNTLLVTSRVVGYQAARLSGDFAHYTIQPLQPKHIAGFVAKWYAAVEREAGEAELSEVTQERAKELSRTIQERPGIGRLAENPLLLTIIALVNWRGRKLPNLRVELYAHAAETLIESWPYQRQGVELETERVIRLLSPVAYRIFGARSGGDIVEGELLEVLSEAIRRVDGLSQRHAQAYAAEFLGQVSEHSGIFRERGYDERGRRVFGFLHLTFAEYFTARHLAGLWEGLGEDATARRVFLRKYAHVPRWREAVLLMAGDVGRRDNDRAERATRLLGDMLTLGSDYEDRLHRDLLLAGACLADDLRVQPRADRYVLNRLLELALKPGGVEAIQGILCTLNATTHGQFVVEKLVVRLEDQDKQVRRRAARLLGALGDARAIQVLMVLLDDDEREMRARAAKALGQIGNKSVVEPLLRRLEDENRWVRANAAEALGELGDTRAAERLLMRLKDEDRWVRVRAARALRKLGHTRAMESLLPGPEDDEGVEKGSAGVLGDLGDPQTLETLLTRLKDKDARVRASVAWVLGTLGDPRALEPLLMRLEDENRWVRWGAVEALGELGDTGAVEPLLTRLEDEEVWVRWSAAWALGKLADTRAVEGLLARLEDREALVRARAAGALGWLGDLRAVESLLALLKDEDEWVRGWTAEALGKLSDTRVVDTLLALLDDEDGWVRAKAYDALIAILNRHVPEPEPEKAPCEPQTVPGPWDDLAP